MPRLVLTLASVALTRAAIAQNANATVAPDTGAWQAPAGSRRFVAVEGVANPWIFDGATTFSAQLVAHGQSIPTRAALAQASVTKALTGPRQTVSHRGFAIDVTEVASAADHDSVIKAVKEQLDLVANVKMSAATQAFFRTVPLVVILSASTKSR